MAQMQKNNSWILTIMLTSCLVAEFMTRMTLQMSTSAWTPSLRKKGRDGGNLEEEEMVILVLSAVLHTVSLSYRNTLREKYQACSCLSPIARSPGVIKLTFKNAWAP